MSHTVNTEHESSSSDRSNGFELFIFGFRNNLHNEPQSFLLSNHILYFPCHMSNVITGDNIYCHLQPQKQWHLSCVMCQHVNETFNWLPAALFWSSGFSVALKRANNSMSAPLFLSSFCILLFCEHSAATVREHFPGIFIHIHELYILTYVWFLNSVNTSNVWLKWGGCFSSPVDFSLRFHWVFIEISSYHYL